MSLQSISETLVSLNLSRVFAPRFRIETNINGTDYVFFANSLFPESCSRITLPSTVTGAILAKSTSEMCQTQTDAIICSAIETARPMRFVCAISTDFCTLLTELPDLDQLHVFLTPDPLSTKHSVILSFPRLVSLTSMNYIAHDLTPRRPANSDSAPCSSVLRRRSTTSSHVSEDALELDLTVGNKFVILLTQAMTHSTDRDRSRTTRAYFDLATDSLIGLERNPADALQLSLLSPGNFQDNFSIIAGFHRIDETEKFARSELHACQLGPCFLNCLLNLRRDSDDDTYATADLYRAFLCFYIRHAFVLPSRTFLLLELGNLAAEHGCSDTLFSEDVTRTIQAPPPPTLDVD